MDPYNNMVNVELDILFFFLNLDVSDYSAHIVIYSKYGRKHLKMRMLMFDIADVVGCMQSLR